MVTDCRAEHVWRRLLLAGGLALALGGCAAGYLGQAARGHLALMRSRQPIQRVLDRPDTPSALREVLQQAQRIREFASVELALPDNASYRSYVDLRRRYVVWNVVAAPALSLAPRQWCFPVAGCVAYRGYFSERAAERFASQLREHGDDVVVVGVPAYSTLGRFADPLTSAMTPYGEWELAALEFHELAHQVAYLPGDSAYNEAFATVVEEEGLSRYAQARGEAGVLDAWRRRRALRAEASRLFAARRGELARVYAGASPTDEKLREKARVMALLTEDLRLLESRTGQPSGYGPWIEAGLNNAHLASIATYYDEVPRFERLLAAVDGDLPRFYTVIQAEVARRRPQLPPPQVGHR